MNMITQEAKKKQAVVKYTIRKDPPIVLQSTDTKL